MKQECSVEIVVRQESSPIVEIILKSGPTSVYRTTLSFPNMAIAEEYAHYMAGEMGLSYDDIIYSRNVRKLASKGQTMSATRGDKLLIEISSENFNGPKIRQ